MIQLDLLRELVAGLGGQTYWRRYLTFIFYFQTWQFDLIEKKIAQRGRPLVMTIRSSAPFFRRGDYCISSLTWAGYVAYRFDGSQGLKVGWARVKLPRLFFVSVRIWAVAGQLMQTWFIMRKTDFESQEKKPLYVSPAVKEIELVTSQRILSGSNTSNDTESGSVSYPNW